MNKQRVLWGVMMLCAAALLLLTGSQAVWAASAAGQPPAKVVRADPSFLGTPLGALSVAGGYYHTCAVTTLGGAQCWSYNGNGELGDGSSTNSLIPVNVSGLTSGVTAIAAGYEHGCAVVSGTVSVGAIILGAS